MYKQRKSQFTRDFDFTKAFLPLTDLMFQDSLDYEIVKQGFNFRHGEFYLHKFNVDRIIGYSIEAEQFTKHFVFFIPIDLATAISLKSSPRFHIKGTNHKKTLDQNWVHFFMDPKRYF